MRTSDAQKIREGTAQQRFQHIERKPQDHWFLRSQDDYGAEEIFIRVEATGLFPRRIGPFKNEETALQFLDTLDGQIYDQLSSCMTTAQVSDIKEDSYTLQYLPFINHGYLPTPNNRLAPTKPGSMTIENYKGVLFLVQELTRHGVMAWWTRMTIGELDPIRSGPFDTEQEARGVFDEQCGVFENRIVDVFPTYDCDHEK